MESIGEQEREGEAFFLLIFPSSPPQFHLTLLLLFLLFFLTAIEPGAHIHSHAAAAQLGDVHGLGQPLEILQEAFDPHAHVEKARENVAVGEGGGGGEGEMGG